MIFLQLRRGTELRRTHVLVKYDKKVVQQSADVNTILLTRRVQHHTETLRAIATSASREQMFQSQCSI